MAETYWDLFFSYSFLWLAIFLFVFSMQGRQKRLLDEVIKNKSDQG